jgi:hypothetical protein
MSKTREQSAIDSIYGMENTLEELLRRVQVMEDNLKLLNNKFSKLSKPIPLPLVKSDSSPAIPPRQQKEQKVEKLLLGNIKLFGYIVNKGKVPIAEVAVNVYDSSNKLVKNTKTNDDGHWEVRLPSGKFGVEYIHKNFKPVNKTVELVDGTKECEVR